MTLLCRPRGRGNWKIVEIGLHGSPDYFGLRRGDVVTFSREFHGHTTFRIIEVRP